jgi:hypothetical protein
MKFSTVASRAAELETDSVFGFVSELKSKARPKFPGNGGILIVGLST